MKEKSGPEGKTDESQSQQIPRPGATNKPYFSLQLQLVSVCVFASILVNILTAHDTSLLDSHP